MGCLRKLAEAGCLLASRVSVSVVCVAVGEREVGRGRGVGAERTQVGCRSCMQRSVGGLKKGRFFLIFFIIPRRSERPRFRLSYFSIFSICFGARQLSLFFDVLAGVPK